MEKIKAIFDGKALTWEEFEKAVGENADLKLVDLSEGGYVAKEKFKEKERELEEARRGTVSADEADKMRAELADMQRRYDEDIADMKMREAVTSALYAAGAKNPNLVRAAIDMTAVSFENGSALGIEEQVRGLRESDPYLFYSRAASPHISSGIRHESRGQDYAGLSDEAYYAARLGK